MKKDIFNIEISVYNGVKDVYGTTCKLRAFLFDKKHIAEIENLRTLPTKEEKNEVTFADGLHKRSVFSHT